LNNLSKGHWHLEKHQCTKGLIGNKQDKFLQGDCANKALSTKANKTK